VSRVDRSTTNVQDRSEFKGVVDQFRKLHLNCKQIGILSCPIFCCSGVPVYFPSCTTRLLSRGSPIGRIRVVFSHSANCRSCWASSFLPDKTCEPNKRSQCRHDLISGAHCLEQQHIDRHEICRFRFRRSWFSEEIQTIRNRMETKSSCDQARNCRGYYFKTRGPRSSPFELGGELAVAVDVHRARHAVLQGLERGQWHPKR
jgi:hypothetical protein